MKVKGPQEEEAILRMQKIYLDAERKIVAEITRKRSLDLVDYAEVAALERVQQILAEMQNETFEYAPIMVETIFHGEGAKNAAGYANARALTTAQTAVVQTLVNNLLGEVLDVSGTVMQSAREYLTVGRLEGRVLRNAALEAVAAQEATGAAWTIAQKQMSADLMGKGITAFVDKAGRKWSLTDYCNMAVRTTARQAEVASVITADDHDLWQIVKIGSTCPVCAVYEGRVYSKSGTNPDYPPLASAFGKIDPAGGNNLENTYLNIHPNCLHSLIKYTTIGKTEKQIQRDKDFSSFEKNPITHDPRTKKQREAYQEKMRNRQKLVNDTHQWKRYKAVLGNECPGWDDFIKHKRAGDDVYKSLESKFRSFSIKAAKNQKAIEKVSKVEYELLNNTGDLESYGKRFVKESWLGDSGVVDFSKTSISNANKVNETLAGIYDEFDIPALQNIKPMNFRQKIFKGNEDAPLCYRYNPMQETGQLSYNPILFKDHDTIMGYQKQSMDAFEYVKNHLDDLSGPKRALAERYVKAGRQLVADDAEDFIKALVDHEVGHHIYYQTIIQNDVLKKIIGEGMEEYAPLLSGYASTNLSEYVAESFCAYRNGFESAVDPQLKGIFEGLRK